MQIDRSNYEIWIIDLLDGNLNSSQVEQLKLFLNQNPYLREEFNDLTKSKLLPPDISFQNKENLKKSPSDISQAQFEYLCAAYLENDLTTSQKQEVDEIVNKNPARKKTFDQIQKTIIIPESISYKHKNLLLKQTTYKKVIWLSVKGISIAAAISLIIVLYSVLPPSTSSKLNNSAQYPVADSLIKGPSSEIAKDNQSADRKTEPSIKKMESRSASINGKDIVITRHDSTIVSSADRSLTAADIREMSIEKVPVYSQVDLGKEMTGKGLVQSFPKSEISVTGDEKRHAGRLISKTFREKFLKEKTPADTPLKGYEIAEAGVSGLNKLLGWQMALDMKKDENGQPKSVIFSSGILKIQTPVKKRESQP
jgi:hypothetical protein